MIAILPFADIDSLLSFRARKLVGGRILYALYLDDDDPFKRLLSLFYRDYKGYTWIQFITPEMWDDDGALFYIVNQIQK